MFLPLAFVACAMPADLAYRGPARDGGEPCAPGATRGDEVCDGAGRYRRRCEGGRLGTDEVCNLEDDDCDGAVDEGFLYVASPPSDEEVSRLQAAVPVSSPLFVRTAGHIALFRTEGVAASDCSETLTFMYFHPDGRASHRATGQTRTAPAEVYLIRPRGDDVIVTFPTKSYELMQCVPPVPAGLCPLHSYRIRTSGPPALLGRSEGHCAAHGVASSEATLLLYPQPPAPGALITHHDLVVVGDDGRIARRLPGALETDGSAVRGAEVGGRVHWFWGTGRSLTHRTTDPLGDDMRVLPDVPLDQETTGLVAVEAVSGSLFLRAGRGGASSLVEVSPAGARLGEILLDVPSNDGQTPSLNRRQVFACGMSHGAWFARFDRTGARLQRSVSLGVGAPSGTCAVIATTSGALVAWSYSEDGLTRWARVGCQAGPQ